MRSAPIALAGIVLVLAAGACSSDDDGAEASRTIEIEMQDIAYSPETVSVTAGETVRFVFTNTGEVVHDAFIGDEAAQVDHEAESDEHGGGHGDDDSDAITVEPGETGELTHTFTAEDDGVLIGCHEPGHYDAGMRLTIDVT